MTQPLPNPSAKSRERLLLALRRLLGNSMGGEPRFLSFAKSPIVHAFSLLALFLVACAAAEILTWSLGEPIRPKIVTVMVWGGAYIAATAFFARVATQRIFATVERDIIPFAPESYLEAVARDLERRDTPARTIALPLLSAAGASAAAAWAFQEDIDVDMAGLVHSPELLFGLAVLFLRFVVSSRSVAAGRFYLPFAERLEEEQGRAFYTLGAAESPLVTGLAKLGGEVLTFWAMTFLAILSAMLIALPLLGEYGFAANPGRPYGSLFLMVFIPIAGFFTLGVGSLVYLRSEATIRSALLRFTRTQAAILQERSNALLDPLAGRVTDETDETDELARLTEWHDRILKGGRYGNRLGTTISILLPFLLPAVSLINFLIEKLS